MRVRRVRPGVARTGIGSRAAGCYGADGEVALGAGDRVAEHARAAVGVERAVGGRDPVVEIRQHDARSACEPRAERAGLDLAESRSSRCRRSPALTSNATARPPRSRLPTGRSGGGDRAAARRPAAGVRTCRRGAGPRAAAARARRRSARAASIARASVGISTPRRRTPPGSPSRRFASCAIGVALKSARQPGSRGSASAPTPITCSSSGRPSVSARVRTTGVSVVVGSTPGRR